jgi:hypothetical protein
MTAFVHKNAKDFIPIARGMTGEAFCGRYDHPFLFGKEVLEEEFRFQTLVTREASMSAEGRQGTDTFRIRHWVMPVKKPDGAPGQDRIFLGRGETNDICVPHRTVSKLHAYFVRDPRILTRWFVLDTGSANGTKANGMRIPGRSRVALVDGDTISFGRCVFQWMSARSLYERLSAMAPGFRLADEDDRFTLPHESLGDE